MTRNNIVLRFLRKHLSSYLKLMFWLLVIFILPVNLTGQVRDVNFDFISADKGLSQNTIHSILQDKQGFMWFATEDGLDRFNGYSFTAFKNDPRDKNSISDNFIWTIYEDHEGTLWVGTNNGGLCKFNRDRQNFTIYKNDPANPTSLSNNNVRAIYEDHEGTLWVGTNNEGLCKFNRSRQNFTIYKNDPANSSSLSNNNVRAIIEDEEGNLWIGTEGGGLNKFDRKTGKFFRYNYTQNDPHSLSNDEVLSLFNDKKGDLWVGTLSGLCKFNRQKNDFTRILENKAALNSHSYSMINSIIEDKSGKIWIGTGGGIFLINKQEEKFVNIDLSSLNFNNISNNILSLFEDRTGIIWIGTAERGIAKYDRERMRFLLFKHDPSDPNSLSYNTIRSFYQDDPGTLWVGTLGGGLNRLDFSTNKFIHYFNQPGNKFSLSDNSVSSIFRDRQGTLWVGTWRGGLDKMISSGKSTSAKFIRYVHKSGDSNSLSSNIVQAIFEDNSSRLWIGTESGLDLYDKKNNKFIHFINNPQDSNSLSNNQVQSCIYQDRNGFIWVGTWGGLNKISLPKNPNDYSPAAYKFSLYRHFHNDSLSLSDDRVISIYQDIKGNLWIGTYGGGLNMLPANQQNLSSIKARFIRYSTKDGLASNIIYGILEDDNGNLWLSTDNGLSKFNPTKQTFRNYYESDGLQGNQFFWGAYWKSKSGELFFGGINGFNAFFPEKLKDNPNVPPVFITDFNVFNKPVPFNKSGSPLKIYITETKKIILSYYQNVFSFEFAALDYTAPNKNQYAYMMEGFDKGWVKSGNRHFVTYTNLDPGKYTFRVRGSNNDGVWNTKGASIKIIILPPFWRTWWFIFSSFIALSSVIIFFISYRVRHLLNIERFRTKLAADLHDNIGSSLTEISIISEVISRKLEPVNAEGDVLKSLRMISEKSRNLIDSMSDIVWLVNPKRDSLYDLILRLRDTYTELSSYKSISFKSENLKSLEKVTLSMEHRQHLYLIFKEGINNCITHSGCSEISLDAYVHGKRLEMVLKDNGNGFNFERSSSGNGLDNIKSRAKKIGGILNIYSEKNKGTTLQFIGNIS